MCGLKGLGLASKSILPDGSGLRGFHVPRTNSERSGPGRAEEVRDGVIISNVDHLGKTELCEVGGWPLWVGHHLGIDYVREAVHFFRNRFQAKLFSTDFPCQKSLRQETLHMLCDMRGQTSHKHGESNSIQAVFLVKLTFPSSSTFAFVLASRIVATTCDLSLLGVKHMAILWTPVLPCAA